MRQLGWVLLALVLPCAGEEPNAADLYRQAFTQVQFKDRSDRVKELAEIEDKGWIGEHKPILDLLARNAVAIESLGRIGEWTRCEYLAGIKVTASTDLSHGWHAWDLGMLAAAKGALEASQGHVAEAAEWYLRNMRMERGLANDGVLISRMWGSATLADTVPGLARVAQNPKCDALTLAGIERALADYLEKRLPFADVWNVEEATALQATDLMFCVLTGFSNESSSKMEDEYRRIKAEVEKADLETHDRWHDECANLVKSYVKRYKSASATDHLGELRGISDDLRELTEHADTPPKKYVLLILPSCEKSTNAVVLEDAWVIAARVIVAIRRYRDVEKTMPATLSELVPKYLPAAPIDPFDGKTLRFAVDGGTARIWSVGPDLTDDGGKKAYDTKSLPPQPGTDMIWELK